MKLDQALNEDMLVSMSEAEYEIKQHGFTLLDYLEEHPEDTDNDEIQSCKILAWLGY